MAMPLVAIFGSKLTPAQRPEESIVKSRTVKTEGWTYRYDVTDRRIDFQESPLFQRVTYIYDLSGYRIGRKPPIGGES
jgi:hypothetical protein